MKNLSSFLLLAFLLLLASCNNEKNTEAANTTNEALTAVTGLEGKIPAAHPIFMALKEPAKHGFREANEIYKKHVSKNPDTLSKEELKQLGFLMIMENNLVEHGTESDKKFYMNEQMAAANNLQNIKGFYELLKSCTGFMAKEEVANIAAQFSKKNMQVIDKLEWENVEMQNAKRKEILMAARNFKKEVLAQ